MSTSNSSFDQMKSKDESLSSGRTQTRFSFYEASDFVEYAAPKEENCKSRFNFYDAQEVVAQQQQKTEKCSEPVAATPTRSLNQPKPAIPSISPPQPHECSSNAGDSVHILKFLQEHESQRVEVTGNGSIGDNIAKSDIGAQAHSNSSDAPDRAVVLSATSNAYEAAIKEALELIRAHRSQKLPQPTQKLFDVRSKDDTMASMRLEKGLSEEPSPSDQRMLQARDLDASLTDSSNLPCENGDDSSILAEAYQMEIEARRRQRQERMARYATRLAELKHEDGMEGEAISVASAMAWVDTLDSKTSVTKSKKIETCAKLQEQHPQSAVPAARNTDPMSTADSILSFTQKDEEIQRGVESVLMAILERAKTSRRCSNTVLNQEIELDPSWRHADERKHNLSEESSKDDALVQTMADLLDSNLTDGSIASVQVQEKQRDLVHRNEATYHKPEAAYADTLHPLEVIEVENTSTASSSSTHGIEVVRKNPWLAGEIAELDEVDELDNVIRGLGQRVEREDLNDRVRSRLGSKDLGYASQNSRNSERDPLDDSFDRKVRKVLSGEKVLGDGCEDFRCDVGSNGSVESFNKEGDSVIDETTQSDADFADEDAAEDDSYVHNDALDNVLGPLSRDSGGITGVVLEPDSPELRAQVMAPPSTMESLSGAMPLVTGRISSEEETAEYRDRFEANELMRTLCAHRLPVGIDQTEQLLNLRPAWDEANVNEPGYRIVRLTTKQLEGVERAYDAMVNKLNESSERSTDEAFERDLNAAEELLDREERRLTASYRSNGPSDHIAVGFLTDVLENESLGDASSESRCLSGFPGVKLAGKGEMGDLEYFYLPIIFKSHVTGFEPTKDLFLEQGNIVAGQYLVEGELGSAAFSTAYRCTDLNSDQDSDGEHEEVCLKVIKNTKDFFDQSLDEIKILELLRQTGKCNENHLIEMKTFFYHREHLIIVTELLRQNLFEFGKFIIEDNEEPYFTMNRLAYITRQCLTALRFVHNLGLVHSDVKPENILLASYSRAQIKLIDFGSSCYLTDRQSSYIQSRSYRAPEVVLGLPYDGRIDIWSLGCVVAEMYTGEVTFQNDSIVSMLSRIEAICGAFPYHMIVQGRQSENFFTKRGLLFESLSEEEETNNDSHHSDKGEQNVGRKIDIFQPKATTLASRLGFTSDLLEKLDNGKTLSKDLTRQAMFVDFVRKLLTIDPEVRPTAGQALEHPWMKYASALKEEDILYPSL
jgi:serine/threonine protein kinase